MEKNIIYNRNCIEVLRTLPDNCVSLFNEDMPYNVTNNSFEYDVLLEEYWKERLRVAKKNAVFVLSGVQPFTADLVKSNRKMFKYEIIWKKTKATNHLNAKKQPLRAHENLVVFYKGQCIYNPQKTKGHKPVNSYTKHTSDGSNYGATKTGISGGGSTERYPTTVWEIKSDTQKSSIHPNQKPLELYEKIILTFTNPGDLVFDGYAGSGTTAVAAQKTKRDFITCEWHPLPPHTQHFIDAKNRILESV